jgi:hypothetical protein
MKVFTHHTPHATLHTTAMGVELRMLKAGVDSLSMPKICQPDATSLTLA